MRRLPAKAKRSLLFTACRLLPVRLWTLLVVLTVLFSTDPAGASAAPVRFTAQTALFEPRTVSLHEAELARRNGDYDGAAAILGLLATHAAPPVADEALLQLAVVLVEAQRPDDAAHAARELLHRSASSASRGRATFVLGRAQAAAGDCATALASFSEAQLLYSELGSYLDLQMADCSGKLDDRVGQAHHAARALAVAGTRRARIDALEHQVDAARKSGDLEAAVQASQPLLAAAPDRAYRAKTLAGIGTLHAQLGRRDEAIAAFATAVAELPETPSALVALEGLRALDGLAAVGPDHVGLVQHFRGRHGDAAASLANALSQGLSGERAAIALYHFGVSLLRLNQLNEAVAALLGAASVLPEADLAAQALLRAGRALDTSGRVDEAGAVYQQAMDAYAGRPPGHEAHQRLVLTLLRRGAAAEAVATAGDLVASDADGRWKGLALLWAGKAFDRAGDGDQAQTAWHQATDVDPDYFGGLRAGAILGGDSRARHAPRPLNMTSLSPATADHAELEQWLTRLGTDSSTLRAERLSDGNYLRAEELFRLGLREQARWELHEVAARVAGDPPRLYGLADLAAERGESQLSMRFAVEARQSTGEPFHVQPRLLQRLIFPLPYAELIVAHAHQRGVDPLLVAALVRQESAFNAAARSPANALGLAQVIPPTGEGIARALGRADFRADDLMRPVVSIEFGVYYLASQLNAYQGHLYPALAAYNAGGGAVSRWLRELGTEDADLFADSIPYVETNHYVHIVYENYLLYRRLYGG